MFLVRLVTGLAFLIAAVMIGRGAHAQSETAEHILGDPAAPVTIIEYASLTCPHCAAFHKETLPGLKERYIDTGKVKLNFQDFPLDENAVRAAMLTHCAGPERYYRFLDVFFAQQASWANARDPVAAIKQLAKLGGMSEEAINACLSDRSVEDTVLQARLEGQEKHGVRSTPSFIIDGKLYAGNRTVDEFAEIIDPLLDD
jgi:protein-disulfide isomerase